MLKAILSKFNMPLIWAIIVSIMVVGYMRIDNLTIRLDNEKQRSEQLEEKVTQIAKSYNEFSMQVSRDIADQKNITSVIKEGQEKNRKELEQLRDTFNYSADGSVRDIEKIIEKKPTLLQRRINDATKVVGQEIQHISNYNN